MVAAEIMQRYKKLQFERGRCPGVLVRYDSRGRVWIPRGGGWGMALSADRIVHCLAAVEAKASM